MNASSERPELTREEIEALSETLFVLWGFPEPTQTFIIREMIEMERLGVSVKVLAGRGLPLGAFDSVVHRIMKRSVFLGPPLEIALGGASWFAKHPKTFGRDLLWAVGLPHRTQTHRLRMVGTLLAAAAVASAVDRSDCTYLHAHFASYHTEWTMCLSRLLEVPFGMTAHATGIWKDRNILGEKVAAARVVLSCTGFNVDHLRSVAPEHAHKVHLVRHGLDLDAIGEPAPPPAPDAPWIAIGRLIAKKGFEHLIDAVAELRSGGDEHRVVIIGDGPLRDSLEQQVVSRGVADLVELRGSIPNSDVWRALRESRGLVAPSVKDAHGDIDGTPNVILEAMAMGRPVIGSELSGIPEAVRHEQTGLLVPPGDVDELARAMALLAGDRGLAAKLGGAARALIEDEFNVRRNTIQQIRHIVKARRTDDR